MAAVAFQRLRRLFGDTDAIAGLDLGIAEGSVYVLLGPNGSGKTMCIRAVCGLLRPTSDRVRLLGATPTPSGRAGGRAAARST